jgi:Phasin protein
MAEKSPAGIMAEEGARASRAINETIQRLTGGAGPLMDGFPGYMQAAQEYNAKVMEYTVANTMATFDYFQRLAQVKSTPELVELTTSHARAQFDTMSAQVKELQAIAQKAMPKPGGTR